jgi:uncharacterized protein (DUF2235 family)
MSKNIVLLSDGTGNSSASPFKTNVWRLYQALDIAPLPAGGTGWRQIVYYDNGVGTENFKPLAALGGALGIGVWRNVRDLYTFVCRNYELGDQIYGSGFSRGAFTIRLLMGLIGKCGILKADSEAKLIKSVQLAYEAYRRDFLIRASRQRNMIYHRVLREPKYHTENGKPLATIDLSACDCRQIFPDIRFLGVWDTVDAYGMPVDELKLAIDGYVWPMSFADRNPSIRIQTIRQALSLDEERPTFRPVLWNEVIKDPDHPDDESKQKTLGPERIQQVWFAGVHANVGGGYPDDGLAYTALDWMMAEAQAEGLRYSPAEHAAVAARINPQGEQYDSRSGVAGYYRYGPRKVAELCDDKEHEVKVPTVRVHPGAHGRIAAREQSYAPVALGGPYDVAGTAVAPADAEAMEEAWDYVWWRRVAYFTTLALTAFVGLFALRLVFDWPEVILDFTEARLRWLWSFVTAALGTTVTGWITGGWNWVIGHIAALLPSWASPTVPSFAKYPLTGIVALLLLAWAFFVWSEKMQRRIAVQAEWAWSAHKHLVPAARPPADWHNSVARFLRPITAFLYRWVWRETVVRVLGVVLGLVALVVLSPYWIWRVLHPRRPWMA